jgi:hypothetical protein
MKAQFKDKDCEKNKKFMLAERNHKTSHECSSESIFLFAIFADRQRQKKIRLGEIGVRIFQPQKRRNLTFVKSSSCMHSDDDNAHK